MEDEEFYVENIDQSTTSSEFELVVDKSKQKVEEDKAKDQGDVQNILEYDIDIFTDKPWNKPGADITDYFKYGFNETTWREYCAMQKKKSEFATSTTDWNEGKYSGVRRGFTEIKKDDETYKRDKPRRSEPSRKSHPEGSRWEGRNSQRSNRSKGYDREDIGNKRFGYRDNGKGR